MVSLIIICPGVHTCREKKNRKFNLNVPFKKDRKNNFRPTEEVWEEVDYKDTSHQKPYIMSPVLSTPLFLLQARVDVFNQLSQKCIILFTCKTEKSM